MTKPYDYLFKLFLLGNTYVGKSWLLVRFCNDDFTPSSIISIGVDFKMRTIEIDGKRVKLQIWDTAGQERFRSITTSYLRGVLGVLLVYDITNKRSYEDIKTWVDLVVQHGSEDVERILIGNKCDMEDKRQVTREAGEDLGRQYGITFMETSVLTNINVDEAFFTLARMIKEKYDRNNVQSDVSHPVVNIKPGAGTEPSTKSTCC